MTAARPAAASLADSLAQGVVIFDGAMGTELYRRHVFTNRCYDELNLSNRKLIEQILAEYRNAGCDVLTTNTFGANRFKLAAHGLADQVGAINRAGADIARELADDPERPLLVAGDVGPCYAPDADPQSEKVLAALHEQIAALLEGGVDFILFESLRTRADLETSATAMKRFPGVPYMLSVALAKGTQTMGDEPVAEVFAPLPADLPQPTALGINHGHGPEGLLEPVEAVLGAVSLPLIVQPDAGGPREVDDRIIYMSSPEYVTEYAKRYIALGAAGVGGCCGIGPDHLAEMVEAVRSVSRSRVRVSLELTESEVEPQEPTQTAEKSRLGAKIARGRWCTSVELLPPRGYDLTSLIRRSQELQRQGIDCINIPDGPRASSRISAITASAAILQQAHIEPILHFCCRDKNLIGMQADCLACAALGIRNILFVTGDPPKLGKFPKATGVFDTDAIGMSAVQKRLNQGIDLGGDAISPKTEALIGAGDLQSRRLTSSPSPREGRRVAIATLRGGRKRRKTSHPRSPSPAALAADPPGGRVKKGLCRSPALARAVRVTLVGSITPAFTKSSYLSVRAL
jgi:methionine synthase I (cobalamin-dependent)